MIENFVAGDEAWFMLNGATPLVQMLQGIDSLVVQKEFQKSIYDAAGQKSNLISISLNRDYLDAGDPVKTDFTIEGNKFSTYDNDVAQIMEKSQLLFALKTNKGDLMSVAPSLSGAEITGYNIMSKPDKFEGEYMQLAFTHTTTAQVSLVYSLRDTNQTA